MPIVPRYTCLWIQDFRSNTVITIMIRNLDYERLYVCPVPPLKSMRRKPFILYGNGRGHGHLVYKLTKILRKYSI